MEDAERNLQEMKKKLKEEQELRTREREEKQKQEQEERQGAMIEKTTPIQVEESEQPG